MQVRRRRKKKRRGWVGKRKRQDACVSGREPGGRFSLMAPHCRSRGAALFVHQQHPSSQGHTKQEKKKNQTKENKSNEQKSISKNRFHLFSRLVIGRPQRVDDAMLWRRKEESGAVPDQIFIGHRFFLPAHCVCAPTARLS